jgi:hypothetical protein
MILMDMVAVVGVGIVPVLGMVDTAVVDMDLVADTAVGDMVADTAVGNMVADTAVGDMVADTAVEDLVADTAVADMMDTKETSKWYIGESEAASIV